MKNFTFLKEAKNENAFASEGKPWSCRPEKINMRVTSVISGQNSHLFSQKVFLQSIIYPTKKTIILAWGKKRVLSTDSLFLHRRGNNDCRPLHGTWTLCIFAYQQPYLSDVCSGHRKHPFPWAATPKLPSAPILILSEQIQAINIRHFKEKALGIYSSRAVRNIANDLLKTLLDSLLTACIEI